MGSFREIVALVLILYLPRTSLGDCKTSNWSRLADENRYVIAQKKAMSYGAAVKACEKIGGQLLTIHSATTEKFIKGWIKGCGNEYRIGLTKRRGNSVRWVDGTELSRHDYQNWVPRGSGEYCATIQGCKDTRWRQSSCNDTFFFICEAIDPCSTRPVMTINDGKRLENTNVNLTNEQNVVIKCFLRGFSDHVMRVKLICDLDTQTVGIGEKSVSQSFHINMSTHGKKCKCESTVQSAASLRGALIEQSEIGVNYRTSPRLVNKTINLTHITIETGSDFVLKFGLYANPIPFLNLTKNGSELERHLYNMSTELDDKGLNMSVMITIKEIKYTMSGTYRMHIQNGIQEDLIFVFSIQVISKPSPDLDRARFIAFTGIVILIVLIVVGTNYIAEETEAMGQISECGMEEAYVDAEDDYY